MFDPFAGTGTTLVVSSQLARIGLGVEKDAVNFDCIERRLQDIRSADSIIQHRADYMHTPSLNAIWPDALTMGLRRLFPMHSATPFV